MDYQLAADHVSRSDARHRAWWSSAIVYNLECTSELERYVGSGTRRE